MIQTTRLARLFALLVLASLLVACGQGSADHIQTTPGTAQTDAQAQTNAQTQSESQAKPLRITHLPYDITQMSATWSTFNLDN